jgi:hypothetical protein
MDVETLTNIPTFSFLLDTSTYIKMLTKFSDAAGRILVP